MPLKTASLNAVLSWELFAKLAGFQPRRQGLDSVSFNLNGLDLGTYDELFAASVEVGDGMSAEIDLRNFENLAGETVAFTKVLAVIVKASGGAVRFSPGLTNPLQWFFGSPTDSITLPDKAGLLFTNGQPQVVDATHRTLLFSNPDDTALATNPVTVTVAVLGGTG